MLATRRFSIVIVLSLMMSFGNLHAEQIQIEIPSDGSNSQASALILSAQNSYEDSNVALKSNNETSIVSYNFKPEEISDETNIVAFSSSADGQLSFSTVMNISSSVGTISRSELPVCDYTPTARITPDSFSIYESLVHVRLDRRSNLAASIKEALQGDLLERLKQSEKVLGLSSVPELSASLPPTELVDRLNRILFAIQQYRIQKAKAAEASREAHNQSSGD